MRNNLSRRKFIKDSTAATLAGGLYLGYSSQLFSQTDKKSRVVLIRDKDVLDERNKPKKENVQRMIDQAVMSLVDETDPVKAWKHVIRKDDIVGIKSNVWRMLPTPGELEESIKKRVQDCGVAEKNIGIKDRGILKDKLFKSATALINVRPMRTHAWSGVGTLLKNYIMFVDQPSDYHPDSCADLATIWKLPHVVGRTRLNVLVMYTPLFHGTGPHHFNPKYTWAYKGLIVGFDPVAVDATGVRILLAKRKEFFGEEKPMNPPPKHIFLADTRHKLGTSDPAKIDLVKLGWDEGIFI